MDMDKEYSPSRCSHRLANNTPDDLLNAFVTIQKEETNRVKKTYKCRLNVHYGETERESMDIYFKNEESNTPIFVYIHGGFWVALDKSESGICVAPLVERGYRVVVMEYDLCPYVTLYEIVQQTKKFFKFLLKYAADTNTGEISFCGHSAGGYLITTLLQQDCFDISCVNVIKNVFLISGIYDLRELWKVKAANPNNILQLNEKSASMLSSVLFDFPVAMRSVNFHIITAEHDSSEFRAHSANFVEKLQSKKFKATSNVLPGYDHFTIIEELRYEDSLIMKLILKELGLK